MPEGPPKNVESPEERKARLEVERLWREHLAKDEEAEKLGTPEARKAAEDAEHAWLEADHKLSDLRGQ